MLLNELFEICISDNNGVKDIEDYCENHGIDEAEKNLLVEIVVMTQRQAFECGIGTAIRLYTQAVEAKM